MRKNLLEYFDETVEKKPEKIAVVDGERKISFLELSHMSKALAIYLCQVYGEKMKYPIGVFLPKSIESIVSDLGIIYTGNAYMNLDIKTPIQRIKNILNLVDPLCIITSYEYIQQLREIWPEEKILCIENIHQELDSIKESNLYQNLEKMIDTDPLCLINTSGSTGTPKSVILNHKSFIDFTDWAITTTKLHESEIIGSLSPIVFDIYSFELCMLMAKSSTLVVIPDTLAPFPAKILQLMQDKMVTYIFWVPTIMVNIANMGLLERIPMPELKKIWFAGEVFPTKQLNIWRKALPQACFINLYGPIEITLDCTYFIFDRPFQDSEPIPIGFPCRNTDIILLDEADHPVTAPFIEGELCVRGTSLAMGYYNNPEKTAAAFVQNPLNHSYPELIYRTGDIACYNDRRELMFKGRRDTLIKHSGYRIELGEIEHVIVNVLKLVKNGCAIYNNVQKKIVFYYEADTEISLQEWRRSIGTALPKYMIPTQYIQQKMLPRNTNGKIDRLGLQKRLIPMLESSREA